MWELYDTLLEGIRESETVEDFLIGPRWAVVLSSSGSAGIAPVIVEQTDRFEFSFQPVRGMPLREVASYVKSWNLMEASLALAAVNAFYNRSQTESEETEDSLPGSAIHFTEPRRVLPGGRRVRHTFRTFCQEKTAEGTTVLAEPVYQQEELAELPGRRKVLRSITQSREYYYSAYRELIPEADRLVLSGKTFVEKTAEPLIGQAVSNRKEVFLFGPDIPMCPALRQHGIHAVWGFVVDRPQELMQIARVNMARDAFLRLGHFEALE